MKTQQQIAAAIAKLADANGIPHPRIHFTEMGESTTPVANLTFASEAAKRSFDDCVSGIWSNASFAILQGVPMPSYIDGKAPAHHIFKTLEQV